MKKYKLIEIYPGSPKLGAMAFDKNGSIGIVDGEEEYSLSSSKPMHFENMISKQPKFWQEIGEKDYEILSLSYFSDFTKLAVCDIPQIDGKTFINNKGVRVSTNSFGKGGYDANVKIHSIKRLSDDEIFTIGDLVRLNCNKKSVRYPIHDIKLEKICGNEGLLIYIDGLCASISNFAKADVPLFMTDDLVHIYEGDIFYAMLKKHDNFILEYKSPLAYPEKWFTFSTLEKANDQQLKYKPLLSYFDVQHFIAASRLSSSEKHEEDDELLLDIIKLKL